MKKFLLSAAIGLLEINFSFAQVQIDKPIQMTGNTSANRQIKNVGEATQATDAVNAESVQSGKLNYADATGSVNDFTVSLSPAPTAYTPGMIVNFKSNNATTGAATINVNGLGAKAIKKQVTTDLASNDILAGQLVSLIYDGSNFQMLGGQGNSFQNNTALTSGPEFLSTISGGTVNYPGNANWITTDVSQQVPANAKSVILLIDPYIGLSLRSSSTGIVHYYKGPVSGLSMQIVVPLSANKTFDHQGQKASDGWVYYSCWVIGYY